MLLKSQIVIRKKSKQHQNKYLKILQVLWSATLFSIGETHESMFLLKKSLSRAITVILSPSTGMYHTYL